MKFSVEPSRAEDLPLLAGIETRAAQLFAASPVTAPLGLHLDAGPPRDFGPAHKAGLLWVARGGEGVPVGFALVEVTDDGWHLEEMDVEPAQARQGIGAKLLHTVCGAALARGTKSLTLCTFRDVPWNAPYYARLGFELLECHQITPALHARIIREEQHGLPCALRVAMRWIGT